ncbi:hypothetical protein DICVIV_03349 [Dictyocaulus viviparus]|uniref:Pseudouridine synthase RsuA/RluA-like domain-containing protein n=1 Tax=Dictyocaulus viviparus TaxID=29172 RepID=A0A0D8Y399_DICVI|nr:hypothetical protein DICVIV_03349 [Dictyocaulus viviparus]
MSENSDGDFFGIEYMTSNPSQFHLRIEAVEDVKSSKNCKLTVASRLHSDECYTGYDDSRLSGTEYFDKAFFPQIGTNAETAQHDEEQSTDFFEDNFFRRDENIKLYPIFMNSVEIYSLMKFLIKSLYFSQLIIVLIVNALSQAVLKTNSYYFQADFKYSSTIFKFLFQFQYDELSREDTEKTALEKIRSNIVPVWRMSQDELVNLMANRARVAPKCERLCLVKSLDKYQSGVILFATNSAVQSALKEDIENGLVEHVTRCIVRDELEDSPLKITIPLFKTLKNRDFKLQPLTSNSIKKEIFYVESLCRTLQGRKYISCVEVRTRKEIPHQVRAHLAMARCPLIGDPKYSKCSPIPPKLSQHVLDSLNLSSSQARSFTRHFSVECSNTYTCSNASTFCLDAEKTKTTQSTRINIIAVLLYHVTFSKLYLVLSIYCSCNSCCFVVRYFNIHCHYKHRSSFVAFKFIDRFLHEPSFYDDYLCIRL